MPEFGPPESESNQDLENPDGSPDDAHPDLSGNEWIFTISGTGEYQFEVSEAVHPTTAYDATIDMDDPQAVDEINGTSVRGNVEGGKDSYVIAGQVMSVVESSDSSFTYYANGTKISRSKLFEQNGAPSGGSGSGGSGSGGGGSFFDGLDKAQLALAGVAVLAVLAMGVYFL